MAREDDANNNIYIIKKSYEKESIDNDRITIMIHAVRLAKILYYNKVQKIIWDKNMNNIAEGIISMLENTFKIVLPVMKEIYREEYDIDICPNCKQSLGKDSIKKTLMHDKVIKIIICNECKWFRHQSEIKYSAMLELIAPLQ